MREIPIVFPISLAIIVLLLLFTSAYAITSSTVANEQLYDASLASDESGENTLDRSFYQKAAFAVCPLH